MTIRSLAITTVKTCSVNCYPYCPQLKFREAYGDREAFLSYDDFKLALSHVPKDVRIIFAGFSEPFLNSRTVDMITLAKEQGHLVSLFTTLVGLRAEDARRLPKGLGIALHLPDGQGIAHIPITENYKETLVEVIRQQYIFRYVKMGSEDFVPSNSAGNRDGAKPLHVRGPFWCGRLTTPHPIMLPNLDVVLCCMDMTLKHRLGSIREQSYDEIVEGEAFKKIARERWKMDGQAICRSCSAARPLPRAALVLAIQRIARARLSRGVHS
jgi:hypothetical protein